MFFESSGSSSSENDLEKNQTKNRFTLEEDDQLKLLVQKIGENWSKISQIMKTKNSRQCRNRWKFYLTPQISKEPFTEEETKALLFWVEKCGTDWSTIVHLFPGRSCPALKNHFVTYCNRNNIDRTQFIKIGKEIREERKKKLSSQTQNKSNTIDIDILNDIESK